MDSVSCSMDGVHRRINHLLFHIDKGKTGRHCLGIPIGVRD
jgi:hypothetical protein